MFDLQKDPMELNDLGDNSEYANIIDLFMNRLSQWARRPSQRTTVTDKNLIAYRDHGPEEVGIFIGVYGEDDMPPDVIAKTRNRQ